MSFEETKRKEKRKRVGMREKELFFFLRENNDLVLLQCSLGQESYCSNSKKIFKV